MGMPEPSKPVGDAAEKLDEIAAVFVALKDLLTGGRGGAASRRPAGAVVTLMYATTGTYNS